MTDLPPLTDGQARALARFQRAHGAAWKEQLWADWMNAAAEPELHRLRNTHGPSWLADYAPPAPA